MSFYGNIGDSTTGTASKKPSPPSGSGKKSGLLATIQTLAKTRASTKAKKQEEKTKRKIGLDTITAAAPEMLDAGEQFLMDQGIIPSQQEVAPAEEPVEEAGPLGLTYTTWALIGVGTVAAVGAGYYFWKRS